MRKFYILLAKFFLKYRKKQKQESKEEVPAEALTQEELEERLKKIEQDKQEHQTLTTGDNEQDVQYSDDSDDSALPLLVLPLLSTPLLASAGSTGSYVPVENYIPVESDGFISPVAPGYRVSSGFGPRERPTKGASKDHKGVDIGVPIGTPVYASEEGVVTHAEWQRGYGNVIYIKHANGVETRYGHLSQFNVKPGQIVKKGQQIALSGNTGVSTGPHLHFEWRQNGTAYNPIDIVRGTNIVQAPTRNILEKGGTQEVKVSRANPKTSTQTTGTRHNQQKK